MHTEHTDIVIIGAGPAGSVAAALLRRQGREVLVIEKQEFPRFAIGESLLPHSMQFLEEAGMLRDVVEAGFQHRNGVAFAWRDQYADFDFRDKTSEGWATAYHVPRDDFDDILADAAERAGAVIRFRHEVVSVDVSGAAPRVMARSPDGESYAIHARFLLDASGSARVLPRLLELDSPSGCEPRGAIHTHIEDGISTRTPDGSPCDFDRHKLLVRVHPEHADVWYWLIPFAKGRSSLGVVASAAFLDAIKHEGDDAQKLRALVAQDRVLSSLLAGATWDSPVRRSSFLPTRAESTCGPGWALLGDAGAFADPVFCSGVTIALKSASLAAHCLRRELEGEQVDWRASYAVPLTQGIETFRAYVDAWYSGAFQQVAFARRGQSRLLSTGARRMISSVLAGYAWDELNPYARDARRRLRALEHSAPPRAGLHSSDVL